MVLAKSYFLRSCIATWGNYAKYKFWVLDLAIREGPT